MDILITIRQTGLRIFIIWAIFPLSQPLLQRFMLPALLNTIWSSKKTYHWSCYKSSHSFHCQNLICSSSSCYPCDPLSTIKLISISLSWPTPHVILVASLHIFPFEFSAANFYYTHNQPKMHLNLLKLFMTDTTGMPNFWASISSPLFPSSYTKTYTHPNHQRNFRTGHS